MNLSDTRTRNELRFERRMAELARTGPEGAEVARILRERIDRLVRMRDRVGEMVSAGATLDEVKAMIYAELLRLDEPATAWLKEHAPHLMNDVHH